MSGLIVFFVTCFIITTFILTIIVIVYYFEERPSYCESCLKIKFSDFKKWYTINPDDWNCYDGYVDKWIKAWARRSTYYFNFIDFFRYKRWNKRRIKRRKNIANNKKLEILLLDIQADIDNFKKQIDRENEEARKTVENVRNRINMEE